MRLNITWLGQPKEIQTKFGLKQKNSIKATQFGDNFLSFWVSPMTNEWAVGKEIEVLEVKSREYNGKTYYDIQLPKANMGNSAEFYARFEKIENAIARLGLDIARLDKAVFPPKPNTMIVNGKEMEYIDNPPMPDFGEEPPLESLEETFNTM